MRYDFVCARCGAEKEITCKISERDHTYRCDLCGEAMDRVVSKGTSFALKGAGWYRDGYASKPKKPRQDH